MKTFVEEELRGLINQCVSNDRLAQEKIYKLFFNKMMASTRVYIPCPCKAEESLNNGFLRAFKLMHQFKFEGSFEGWLRKIVFHASMDYIKADKKNKEHLDIDKMPLSLTPSVKADTNLEFEQLLKLVDRLPKATRTVFHMYIFEGYTHKQIGSILDIDEGTSKWHLSQGREVLRSDIKRMKLNVSI